MQKLRIRTHIMIIIFFQGRSIGQFFVFGQEINTGVNTSIEDTMLGANNTENTTSDEEVTEDIIDNDTPENEVNTENIIDTTPDEEITEDTIDNNISENEIDNGNIIDTTPDEEITEDTIDNNISENEIDNGNTTTDEKIVEDTVSDNALENEMNTENTIDTTLDEESIEDIIDNGTTADKVNTEEKEKNTLPTGAPEDIRSSIERDGIATNHKSQEPEDQNINIYVINNTLYEAGDTEAEKTEHQNDVPQDIVDITMQPIHTTSGYESTKNIDEENNIGTGKSPDENILGTSIVSGLSMKTSLNQQTYTGINTISEAKNYIINDTLYEENDNLNPFKEIIFPEQIFSVSENKHLIAKSVYSVEVTDDNMSRCSLITKHNLMRLSGKGYQSGISPDNDSIAAGDAITLIQQGKENNALTAVKINELAPYLQKHSEAYDNASLFDVYIYQPQFSGAFQGHRLSAFIAEDTHIYVLDPLMGEKTNKAQKLETYLENFDDHVTFYVKDIPYNIKSDTQTTKEKEEEDKNKEKIDIPLEISGFILEQELRIEIPTPLLQLPPRPHFQNSNENKIIESNASQTFANEKDRQTYEAEQKAKKRIRKTYTGASLISSIEPLSTTPNVSSARFTPETKIISTQHKKIDIPSLQLAPLAEKPKILGDTPMIQGIELGPQDDHLIFSKPVQIDIPINPELNGEEVDILVHHLGDEKFSRSGLTTDSNTTCRNDGTVDKPTSTVIVNQGKASIYTCGASSFVVTYVGGANTANFVDNSSKDKIITVTTGDVALGSSITNITVTVDFHTIDGTDPVNPGPGSSYGNEDSFQLRSPSGTLVHLLNTSTYNSSHANRVTVTFDDTAGSAPSGTPTTGTFTPADNLSTFNGENPLGDWTFTFADSTNDDGLILFQVDLNIDAEQLCGNNTLDSGEGCDDGNTTNGDGCNDTCKVENGSTCNSTAPGSTGDASCASGVCDASETPDTCEAANTCGNNLIEAGESCDDGNTTDGDGCSSSCTSEYTSCSEPNITVNYVGGNDLANFTDNASITKTITVPTGIVDPSAVIESMKAIVDFHTIDGNDPANPGPAQSYGNEDYFYLQSPTSTQIHLLNSGTYDNAHAPRVTVTFDDSAGSAPSGTPTTGTFTPADNLSTFNGEDPEGDWIFTLGDTTNGDGISLYEVTLEINTAAICGDGIVECTETCDDGNTDDGDGCDSSCQVESNYSCTYQGTGSVCTVCTEDLMIGATVKNVGSSWQTINFSDITNHSYIQTPLVLATPNTQNGNDSYPIPRIRNVSTTSFDISICLDDGNTTCGNPTPEDVGIFVIDQDKASCAENFDAGIKTNVSTDGADTATTFNKTFTNTPYVFTTPQTSNQGDNIAGIAWVDDMTTTQANLLGCVHQGVGNACTTGQPTEDIGWIAIDPTLFSMTGFQQGTADISNSNWTAMTFSPSYSQAPSVMVTQNDDDGGQDPQYAWAKDITTNGGQFRYCEQDGSNYCDTHTSEFVRWFSLPTTEIIADGDMCITAPSGMIYSGTYQSENYTQTITQTFSGYFTISDDLGADSGYYTTLQITNLTGSVGTISNSNISRKASGTDYISGDVNTGVVLDTIRSNYFVATGINTFIKRDTGTNNSKKSTYGAKPTIQINIPPYTKADTYQGTITYTLYEN